MQQRLALLAAVVLAIAAALYVSTRPPTPTEPPTETPAADAPDEPTEEPDLAELADAEQPEESRSTAEVEAEPTTVAAEAPTEAAPAEDDLAHLVGTFLLADGSPAAGATVQFRGWTANSEREQKYGRPENWENFEVTTDAEGRLDLAFDPPRAYQFVLDVSVEGHAELSWRWSTIEPRSTTDVGTQTFTRACTVRGRVVDADGAPTGIAWFIYGDSNARTSGAGGDNTRVRAPVDVNTGQFELKGVPPGAVSLKAYSKAANWIDGPTVRAKLDEIVEADIVYEGPDLSRTITVTTFCRGFHIFNTPREGRILARAADGTEYEGAEIKGSSQSFVIEDLPPGSYTVEIESSVHEPWSKAGVQPGETVSAHLKGGARIALTVVDDESNAPIERYQVRLRFERSRWSPNVFEILRKGKEPPAGGLFEGLIPWDTTLLVKAEGYAEVEVPLGEITAGTTTPAEARLMRGASIVATVVTASGEPAAGAKVLLHPHAEGYDPRDPFSGPRDQSGRSALRDKQQDETTDAAGVVRFEGLAPGSWGLLASSGALEVREEKVDAANGSDVEVRLVLPASGSIEGRLTGAPAGSFEGLIVRATPTSAAGAAASRNARMRGQDPPGTAVVDAEDRFVIDDLVAGEHSLVLTLPSGMIPTSRSSSSGNRSAALALGEVDVAPGAPTVVSLDASKVAPGTLSVTVTQNGDAAFDVVVLIGATNAQEGTLVDNEGKALFDPCLPGSWTVMVRPLGGRWLHKETESVVLEPGADVAVEIALEISTGRIRILDAATGKPAASKAVYLNGLQGVKTDGEGWLELELPAGDYGFTGKWDPRSNGEAGSGSVTWGPGGPSVEELTLSFEDA